MKLVCIFANLPSFHPFGIVHVQCVVKTAFGASSRPLCRLVKHRALCRRGASPVRMLEIAISSSLDDGGCWQLQGCVHGCTSSEVRDPHSSCSIISMRFHSHPSFKSGPGCLREVIPGSGSNSHESSTNDVAGGGDSWSVACIGH